MCWIGLHERKTIHMVDGRDSHIHLDGSKSVYRLKHTTFAVSPQIPDLLSVRQWFDISVIWRAHKVLIRQRDQREPRGLLWLFWILCWQACFLSPARPVVSSAHGWLPLCMPGLSWEPESYMAEWNALIRVVLLSIPGNVSSTNAGVRRHVGFAETTLVHFEDAVQMLKSTFWYILTAAFSSSLLSKPFRNSSSKVCVVGGTQNYLNSYSRRSSFL